MKRTALIDLDGPVLDVSSRHYCVYFNAVNKLKGQPVSRKAFWSAKRNRIPESVILARSGLLGAEDEYRILKLATIESNDNLAFDRLQPGVPLILQRISKRSRLILVTLRRFGDRMQDQLASLGIACLFDTVLSCPVSSKPGWETKRDLVVGAGIALEGTDFFVGDTETDILAGKALGIETIAVCNGIRNKRLLKTFGPDWIIKTSADLPNNYL